jgi:hypothetical protein
MSKGTEIAFAGLVVLASAAPAAAFERVGEAVKINTVVVGAEGAKNVGDAVYRDELVRANATGLGQFEFKDGTKLAIGPNASVVIDKYVLGEGGTLKKLAIRATKGTFRFIGGRSPPSAYTILTPAGTMGVRGTANEVQILPDGRVIVVQLEGSSEFCTNPNDRRTCRVLNKPCDFIVANGKTGEITDPKQISDEAVDPDNFPLLRDDKELVEGFNLGGISCGLSNSASAQAINPAVTAAVIGAGGLAAIVVLANSGDNEEKPVTPP